MFKIKNKITSEVRTVYYITEEKDRVKYWTSDNNGNLAWVYDDGSYQVIGDFHLYNAKNRGNMIYNQFYLTINHISPII